MDPLLHQRAVDRIDLVVALELGQQEHEVFLEAIHPVVQPPSALLDIPCDRLRILEVQQMRRVSAVGEVLRLAFRIIEQEAAFGRLVPERIALFEGDAQTEQDGQPAVLHPAQELAGLRVFLRIPHTEARGAPQLLAAGRPEARADDHPSQGVTKIEIRLDVGFDRLGIRRPAERPEGFPAHAEEFILRRQEGEPFRLPHLAQLPVNLPRLTEKIIKGRHLPHRRRTMRILLGGQTDDFLGRLDIDRGQALPRENHEVADQPSLGVIDPRGRAGTHVVAGKPGQLVALATDPAVVGQPEGGLHGRRARHDAVNTVSFGAHRHPQPVREKIEPHGRTLPAGVDDGEASAVLVVAFQLRFDHGKKATFGHVGQLPGRPRQVDVRRGTEKQPCFRMRGGQHGARAVAQLVSEPPALDHHLIGAGLEHERVPALGESERRGRGDRGGNQEPHRGVQEE